MLSGSARSMAGMPGDAPVLDSRGSDRWAAAHDVRVIDVAAEDHLLVDAGGEATGRTVPGSEVGDLPGAVARAVPDEARAVSHSPGPDRLPVGCRFAAGAAVHRTIGSGDDQA